ncbi:DoxX family protein [Paraflavitalea sp. CAU 1676]|uniref:DoxX family protein n=1 Tax=Paraflavitalea sp. CAU 1676 TaxID=3032598 RepID=UPI0023D9EC6E|nr:DoxX family protein [Paraflavitalea sp. CAU 1676]MDF2188615.1 DoxX family protein [Paraflavitalea sp. CAU 1676]
MKKLKILYWIFTGLLIAGLATGSVFELFMHPGAIEPFTVLGYPTYLAPFMGIARLLGLFAIVYPRFPRITEWAYAGLTFDILGATYSLIVTGHGFGALAFPLVTLLFLVGSYVTYHKRSSSNNYYPTIAMKEAAV